jgi:hypothetical protein
MAAWNASRSSTHVGWQIGGTTDRPCCWAARTIDQLTIIVFLARSIT